MPEFSCVIPCSKTDNLSIIIPEVNENHEALNKLKLELEAIGAEVIVVDDGSEHPFPGAAMHGFNAGYGAAILTGVRYATRPIILTIDGDSQHRIQDVKNLYNVWNMLDVDMIVGVRRITNEKWIRYIGRKFLNMTASLFCLYWLADLNSGLRIVKKELLESYAPILCKQFSFTTSLTMSMMLDKRKIEWFPIKVAHRQHGKSRVKVVKHGLLTLYYIVRIGFALRTRTIRRVFRRLRGMPV